MIIADHETSLPSAHGTRAGVDMPSTGTDNGTRVTPGKAWAHFAVKQIHALDLRDDRETWNRQANAGTRRAATDHAIREREHRDRTFRFRHLTPDGRAITVVATFLPMMNRTRCQWFVEDERTWSTAHSGRPVEPDWHAVDDGRAPSGSIALR